MSRLSHLPFSARLIKHCGSETLRYLTVQTFEFQHYDSYITTTVPSEIAQSVSWIC